MRTDTEQDATTRERRPVPYLILLAALLCAGTVLYRFDPTAPEGWFFPKCIFHSATGLHCPGCGMTRACHYLLHGRIGTAIRFNAVFVLGGIPTLGWMLFRGAKTAFSSRRTSPVAWQPWVGRIVLVLLVVFTVLRNVPRAPFSYLAPPDSTPIGRESK